MSPGQSVVFKRGGTWREDLIVPSSGSAGAPITFTAYGSGSAPNLTASDIAGAGVAENWTNTSGNVWQVAVVANDDLPAGPPLVWFNGAFGTPVASVEAIVSPTQWYWASDVLYVYSVGNPASTYTSPGIEAVARLHGVWVNAKSYLAINGLRSDYTWIGALIDGPNNSVTNYSSTENANGLEISASLNVAENITVSYSRYVPGLSDGGGIAFPSGNPANCSLRTATVSYTDGYCVADTGGSASIEVSGVACHHFGVNPSATYRQGFASAGTNDSFHDNSATPAGTGGWPGFYLAGAGGNHFRNTASGGIGPGFWLAAANITVSYSVASDHTSTTQGAFYLGSGGTSASLYHNTSYGNYYNFYAVAAVAATAILKNNLSVNSTSTYEIVYEAAGATADYNGVYHSGGVGNVVAWDGAGYTWSAYKTASGQDGNSNSSNPLLTNPGSADFTLQAGSPAIGTGVYIAGVSTANPPNMGAK